jgi:hypothetical protein
MKHHFECPTFSGNPLVAPLIFDWDDEAGTVSGPSAEEITRYAGLGGIPMHPMPAEHTFSGEPLKSRTDMAAIIGYRHQIPSELQAAYPELIEGEVDPDYEDDRPPLAEDQTGSLLVDESYVITYY